LPMKWLRTGLVLLLLGVAFVLAALAANQQELTLTFAIWETPFALSMFWWLLAAFVLGLLCGWLSTAWMNVRHRLHVRELKRDLAGARGIQERLRSANVK